MGGVTVAITFALSFLLTWFVGRICYREGLPSNVVSRYYIFGKKGSAAGSHLDFRNRRRLSPWARCSLAMRFFFAFGWESEVARWTLFIGISCVWVFMALFGTKIIACMNAVFVVALFCVMGYVIYLIAADGQLVEAATHGILIPGVEPVQGFAYSVNYAIMTSGLMALFAADFTRFARRERDIAPIAATGSFFAIITYICGALIVFYGFDKSVAYFAAQGMDPTLAAHAAVTNPGVSLVLAAGGSGVGGHLPVADEGRDFELHRRRERGGEPCEFDHGPIASLGRRGRGRQRHRAAFILCNILDQVNAFMSYSSILTSSWCVLLITDYYIVRGKMGIGRQGVDMAKPEKSVHWRGVGTIAVVTVIGSVLYATNLVAVPFLVVAPLTMVAYIAVSWLLRDKIRAGAIG